MIKRAQTIRRQKPANCLSVFDHFVGLVLKGFSLSLKVIFAKTLEKLKITFSTSCLVLQNVDKGINNEMLYKDIV